MAALDESMGFGFGAIGGAEQSINLGAIDWSPPPKRSHSARQMPRAQTLPRFPAPLLLWLRSHSVRRPRTRLRTRRGRGGR